MTTDAEGQIVEEFFYDPFGRRTNVDNVPLAPQRRDIRVGYTGHQHDDELGLINMRGRIYDPIARRFLTPDPIIAAPLLSQSYNRYSYVQNNPATFTDPTGYWPDWDINICILFCEGGGEGGGGGGVSNAGGESAAPRDAWAPSSSPWSAPTGSSGRSSASSPPSTADDASQTNGYYGSGDAPKPGESGNGPDLDAQPWVQDSMYTHGEFYIPVGPGPDDDPQEILDETLERAVLAAKIAAAVNANGGLEATLDRLTVGRGVPSLGPVRGIVQGELGESLAGREVFLHGTTDEVAKGFELGAGRSLFTTTDRSAARFFAERTVAKVGGGQVGGVAIVLPRAAVSQLRSLGQLIVRPVSDMPQIIEWVFLPGARETILKLGEVIRLPPGAL